MAKRYASSQSQLSQRSAKRSRRQPKSSMYRPTGRNYKKYEKVFRMQSASQAPNLCMIMRNPSCFPDVLYTDLFYTENVTIDAAAASYFWQTSLYDPNGTGIGHQPKWFDSLCGGLAVYRKYEVISAVAEILVCHTQSESIPQNIVQLSFGPTSSSNVLASHAEIAELEYGSSAVITAPSPIARLTCYANPSLQNGLTRGDDSLVANYNASPTFMTRFYLGMSSYVAETTNLNVMIRIKFSCRFFQQFEYSS